MDIITENDKEYFFDQRPTHNPRPLWLMEAEYAAELTRNDLDEYIDQVYSVNGQFDHDRLDELMDANAAAEAWALDARTMFQAGGTPYSIESAIDITVELAL